MRKNSRKGISDEKFAKLVDRNGYSGKVSFLGRDKGGIYLSIEVEVPAEDVAAFRKPTGGVAHGRDREVVA